MMSGFMRRSAGATLGLLGGILLLGASPVAAEEGETPQDDEWPLIAGMYEVIGRECGADRTYSGTVTIVEDGDGFVVTRTIDGGTVKGSGRVESAGPDRTPVFRMRFHRDGTDYVGTFLFGADLDNDGRLSGYVVPEGYRGERPGKEVLFAWKPGEKELEREIP